MRSKAGIRIVVALVAAFGGVVVVGSGPAAAAEAQPVVIAAPDANDEAAVAAFYKKWFATPPAAGFTANLDTCEPGTTGLAYRQAELNALNATRALVGLEAVEEDDALSVQSQAAALVMKKAGMLSHSINASWACYSPAAATGAARSNLALGIDGVDAIRAYLQDRNTPSVGHRSWLLSPALRRVGMGDVSGANAVQVVDGLGTREPSGPIPWPAPGYFPRELLVRGDDTDESGLWSLSDPALDASATVTATVDGASQPVSVRSNSCCSGDPTIVFTIHAPTEGRATTVRVVAPGFDYSWTTRVVRSVKTPGASCCVSAAALPVSARIAWAPAPENGSPVTHYTVTANPGGTQVTATGTSTSFGGLSPGVPYTFTVVAHNAHGPGPSSPPSSAIVPLPPDPLPPIPPPPIPPGPPAAPVPGSGVVPGYWMLGQRGTAYGFGGAAVFGSAPTSSAADLEPTPSRAGYWIVNNAGQVFAYGDAPWLGNAGPLAPFEVVTSISTTRSGQGYWLFTNRGRVMNFGDAVHHGDMSLAVLNGPVLGSITTASGNGYYMVASDGGIFSFGDARFFGSMGGSRLNAPVMALVPDRDGVGYWLVARDGGIFAFDAPFLGSMGSSRLNRPIIGMVGYGAGYLMVGEDGGIFNFSDRPFLGSLGANPPAFPIVSVASTT
ncbi:MAG: fibronectin type III domain-containing protein [Acidimicrobiia bacterium]